MKDNTVHDLDGMDLEPDLEHFDVKNKRARSRKRNIIAKILHDPNEFKGAFHIKAHGYNEYRRVKMKVNNIYDEE